VILQVITLCSLEGRYQYFEGNCCLHLQGRNFSIVIRIGHILQQNCLLKQVTEGKIKGKIEVTRRRGRRRKKLLDDLKDRRGYSHLKEESLDRTIWRNRFGRGVGPVVRQNTE
jgi:hypothetical protein